MKTAIELASELRDLIDLHAHAYVVREQAAEMLLQQAEQIEALKALVDNPRNTPFGKEAEKLADEWLAANGPGGWIDDLRNKCEALEIANAALKADAERLDLLESTFFAKRWNGVIDSGSQTTWHIVPGYQHSTHRMVGHTFRAAIDAAKETPMTTLLSKAQKLIQKIRSDRHDIEDWPKDSLDAFLELEQTIAQEKKLEQPKDVAQIIGDLDAKMHKSFTSQTASTSPVVSQKTAETVDKDCDTCINRQRRMHQEPCFSCHGYTNWEPKP